MQRSERRRGVVTVLLLFVFVGACGDGEDAGPTTTAVNEGAALTTAATTAVTTSTTMTPAAPTKAEFIARADPICSELQGQFAGTEFGSDVTMAEITSLISEQVVPALRTELSGLEALDRPTEDEAEIEAMLSAFGGGLAAIEADPISLLTGDPLGSAREKAVDYGLQVCGSGIIPELPAEALAPTQFTAEQLAVADVLEEFYAPETVFERGLELLADRERVEETLAATYGNPAMATLSSTVTDVTFPDDATCAEQGLDPGCARVVHDFLIGDAVISPDNVSYLLLVDGNWKVSADSFCAVATRAGYVCPDA